MNTTIIEHANEPRNVPAAMQSARRWLLHTADKHPHYASGRCELRHGALDGPEDLARLATLAEALGALQRRSGQFSGVGFALGLDPVTGKHWQGIDLDHSVKDGRIVSPKAQWIFDETFGYAEISPSGTGLHILGVGPRFDSVRWIKKPPEQSIECYASARYFTVTGNVLRSGGLLNLAGPVEHIRDQLSCQSARSIPLRKIPQGGCIQNPALRDWIDMHPIEDALIAHGYRKRGNRWLSPRSTSGVPGAHCPDAHRAVSHHGCDSHIGTVVGNGCAVIFNSFDLMVADRFGGDFRLAMRKLLPRLTR